MLPDSRSGIHSEKAASSALGRALAQAEELAGKSAFPMDFESDFVELAARFAAHGAGNFSPELSAELALEIVLNEIVEGACLAMGATGAAIVLERDGEMSCRASSGDTAPELGARLDPEIDRYSWRRWRMRWTPARRLRWCCALPNWGRCNTASWSI